MIDKVVRFLLVVAAMTSALLAFVVVWVDEGYSRGTFHLVVAMICARGVEKLDARR